MKKDDCHGCYNDDYNYGLGGAEQCWSFDEGKELIRKYIIHRDLPPPYSTDLIKKVPPCYQPQHYCVVNIENIKDGYIK